MRLRHSVLRPLRVFVPLCAITVLLLTSFGRASKAADPNTLKNIDGVSLASHMAGEPPTDAFLERKLYFHYPHYRSSMPHSAVVSGTHKLLHFYERPDISMLFDLRSDMGEVYNIAPAHREQHQRLYDDMMDYFERVGARIPKQNPNYDLRAYQNSKEYENGDRLHATGGMKRMIKFSDYESSTVIVAEVTIFGTQPVQCPAPNSEDK